MRSMFMGVSSDWPHARPARMRTFRRRALDRPCPHGRRASTRRRIRPCATRAGMGIATRTFPPSHEVLRSNRHGFSPRRRMNGRFSDFERSGLSRFPTVRRFPAPPLMRRKASAWNGGRSRLPLRGSPGVSPDSLLSLSECPGTSHGPLDTGSHAFRSTRCCGQGRTKQQPTRSAHQSRTTLNHRLQSPRTRLTSRSSTPWRPAS